MTLARAFTSLALAQQLLGLMSDLSACLPGQLGVAKRELNNWL